MQSYFIRKGIETELRQTIDRDVKHRPDGQIAQIMHSWDATAKETIPHGLTALLHVMDTINSQADIASRIGFLNRHGIGSPLAIYIIGDPRDQKQCRIVIEEGEPRIGIPEYWDWPEYAGHRRAYHAYVRRLAAAVRMPAIEEGWSAEKEFAKVFPTAMERRRRYDTLTWAELCDAYTGIDWVSMFAGWGLSDQHMRSMRYSITSHPFLHHMSARIKSWSLQRWRAWFCLIVVQWAAGMSPHGPLRGAWFAYARRYLQGMKDDVSPTELRYRMVQAIMPNTLGALWVRDHCDPDLKRKIGVMIRHIRDAAAHQLAHTSWMAPATRAAAVKKLRAMKISVCWPDKWSQHEMACGLDDTDLLQNLLRISALGTDNSIRMALRGDCRHPMGEGWGRPVFEVNAFYYPSENQFLLPAAILRPPYYDPTKSLPWNYGGIGHTIGHELCHAFDAEGRGYDATGNRRNWWSERDDREYKKRAQTVVQLYESRDYRGEEVDGQLTLVENIADLGGMEFALGGLKGALGRQPTKEEYREFFESFTISWRAKERIARARELLITDTHAPPRLRVNHTVRQFDEWYAAHDVGAGCPDYIQPADRIHFFA
jgi:putative endopeptidase